MNEKADFDLVHPYANQVAVLTSKHQKINLIAPAFSDQVGLKIIELDLDTDELGTFTGEVERKAPPLETAIQKARLGMDATGTPIGIASEGSIGPDPLIPFIHSDIEHLVLVDDENDIVISEAYRSFDISVATVTVSPGQDLTDFLEKADFPNHRLIVRPNAGERFASIKGISEIKNLMKAVENSSSKSADGLVIIESDLRAYCSPSRQKNIQELANLLALRVSQLCPQCRLPGWGRIGYEKGLHCSTCGLENSAAIRQERLGCVRCNYVEFGVVVAHALDPAQCEFCNP